MTLPHKSWRQWLAAAAIAVLPLLPAVARAQGCDRQPDMIVNWLGGEQSLYKAAAPLEAVNDGKLTGADRRWASFTSPRMNCAFRFYRLHLPARQILSARVVAQVPVAMQLYFVQSFDQNAQEAANGGLVTNGEVLKRGYESDIETVFVAIWATDANQLGEFRLCTSIGEYGENVPCELPEHSSFSGAFNLAAGTTIATVTTDGSSAKTAANLPFARAYIGTAYFEVVQGTYRPKGATLDYDLTGIGAGLRLPVFGNDYSRVRPWLDVGLGTRSREVPGNSSSKYDGYTANGGVGISLFLNSALALEVGGVYSWSRYGTMTTPNGDTDLSSPLVTRATGITVGGYLNLEKLWNALNE